MNVTVSRDRRQATDWLASGKFPLVHRLRRHRAAAKDGLPVAELDRKHLKEAGNSITLNGNSGLALISKAAHPHAARFSSTGFSPVEGKRSGRKS